MLLTNLKLISDPTVIINNHDLIIDVSTVISAEKSALVTLNYPNMDRKKCQRMPSLIKSPVSNLIKQKERVEKRKTETETRR